MTVIVHPTAKIEVDDLTLGEGTTIRAHCEVYGRKVVLGRDSFLDEYTVIGGGSAEVGELVAGDWCMTGMYSQINIARSVHVGDEFGLGIAARVFTHGAWLSEWDGFPVSFDDVTIGDRVWLPNNVTVLPGVTIGDNVVVTAHSVVTRDLPSGCLAGGTPAKVIREDCYPNVPAGREKALTALCEPFGGVVVGGTTVIVDRTDFHLETRAIVGPATPESERLRNELRRHGIRFPYSVDGAEYVRWEGK